MSFVRVWSVCTFESKTRLWSNFDLLSDGVPLGLTLGAIEGIRVGAELGVSLGVEEGALVGDEEGTLVGDEVGACVDDVVNRHVGDDVDSDVGDDGSVIVIFGMCSVGAAVGASALLYTALGWSGLEVG